MLVLVLSGSILLKPLLSPPNDEKQAQAKTRAESLGYQLLQLQADSRKPVKSLGQGRGPASVEGEGMAFKSEGSIGIDPWGSPYKYRVVQNRPDEPEVIEIWSPNLSDKVLISSSSKTH